MAAELASIVDLDVRPADLKAFVFITCALAACRPFTFTEILPNNWLAGWLGKGCGAGQEERGGREGLGGGEVSAKREGVGKPAWVGGRDSSG